MRLVVVVVAIVVATRGVRADTPTQEPVVETYRGTTIMMDVGAAGLVALGLGGHVAVLAIVGVPLYLAGPPLVHLSNRRPRSALASVGLRVGLSMIGLVIGDSLPDRCTRGDCIDSPPTKIVVGVAAGAVAASIIDAVFLAKGDPVPTKTSWRPVAHPTRGGVALGIAGEF